MPTEKLVKPSREERGMEIMKIAAGKWTRSRFLKAGIDPDLKKVCSECSENWSVVMYSLTSGNTLYNKCKICWEGLSEDEDEIDGLASALIAHKKFLRQMESPVRKMIREKWESQKAG